jgi:hypothetical protein
MKVKDVPQEGRRTMPTTMVHYAVDDKGEFVKIGSNGWEVGFQAAMTLRDEFLENAEQAKERVRNNQSSPLEYFMYRAYMELPTLARMIGHSSRKVKKHFKPEVFEKLDDEVLQRYAIVLRVDIRTIKDFKKQLS